MQRPVYNKSIGLEILPIVLSYTVYYNGFERRSPTKC